LYRTDQFRDRAVHKAAASDQAGRFTLRGIAPGNYKLYAQESLENNGYFDPDLQRRAASAGSLWKCANP